MENIKIEKVAYCGNVRGYVFKATYLEEPKSEALIEIFKDDVLVKEFLFPAYKIFNIAAHASDIVDSLEQGNEDGFYVAGSNGLGGNSYVSAEQQKGAKE